MATVTHQSSLPDSSNKTDFYNLVDNSTVTGIVSADISPSAAIPYSKLSLASSITSSDIVDGTIVNADINASAAIAYSKLNLGTSVVNADINASAAIVDTKLAQITTASKVSGTAITGLASLPSGAGVIPTANLPALGAMTFISATSISAAPTTGNIAIVSGNTYFVQFNFVNASGSNPTFHLIFNADSGSHYGQILTGYTSASATVFTVRGAAAALASIDISRPITNSSTTGLNGYFYIQQVGTASQTYRIWGQSTYDGSTSSTFEIANIMGNWNNATNATSFAISPSVGNIDGTVYLHKLQLS